VDRRLWGPKQRGIFGVLIHLIRALSIELKQSNDHTNNSYSGRKWKAARSCVLTTRLHAGDCFRLVAGLLAVCGARAAAHSMVVCSI
jgi:hypothetical protein